MLDNPTTPLAQRLEGYRRLIEITRDLASTLDLNILLDRIVNAAAFITNAEAASILLYDDTARQLYFQVATNLDQPMMRGLVVPLEGSIAGWIVSHRKPVRIANAHEDPRHFDNIERTTQFPTRELLGVPLTTKEKVIGVLETINSNRGNFSETDEDLLCVLGAQAAVAIENARLFQQSDLISEFVHELRTPLASLSTATYLLLRPELSDQQRTQFTQSIHSEALRLNALASSFLDLARMESGRVHFKPSQFDLVEMLRECKDFMQSRADVDQVHLEVEIDPDFPSVEADRDKIKQVVLNLLSNAIKYNRPQGKVTMRAQAEEEWIILAVEDTGIGIPQDDLPHLFQKFYRVRDAEGKASGTGLGLSICKQIVLGHRGTITVDSKAGKGSTFTIKLPRKQSNQGKNSVSEEN
jgi:signal transduction histidine kinase